MDPEAPVSTLAPVLTNIPQYWCRGDGCVHSVMDGMEGAARVIGDSIHADAMRVRIQQAAERGNLVLVTGETGTGKEVVARAIHCAAWEGAPSASLVVLGCSTLPEGCLHNVLRVKGGDVCPDCRAVRLGGEDPGGTLLLDEIGELAPAGQEALLDYLNHDCRGSHGKRPMLIIATTNQDLKAKVDQGLFRVDLFQRLASSIVPVPPLRERLEDIPALLDSLIEEANQAFGTAVKGIAPTTLKRALVYPWPGNVRELKNVILQAVLLARYGHLDEISLGGVSDVPPEA